MPPAGTRPGPGPPLSHIHRRALLSPCARDVIGAECVGGCGWPLELGELLSDDVSREASGVWQR